MKIGAIFILCKLFMTLQNSLEMLVYEVQQEIAGFTFQSGLLDNVAHARKALHTVTSSSAQNALCCACSLSQVSLSQE